MSARPGQIAELKAAIAEHEAARPAGVAGAPAELPLVRRVVAEEVARVCGIPAEHLHENVPLAHLARFDDLDVIELSLAIEERLQLLKPLCCRASWRIGDVVLAASVIPREAPRP